MYIDHHYPTGDNTSIVISCCGNEIDVTVILCVLPVVFHFTKSISHKLTLKQCNDQLAYMCTCG